MPFLLAFFVLVGVVYGFTVGSFKKGGRYSPGDGGLLTSLTGYIVLVLSLPSSSPSSTTPTWPWSSRWNAATFLDNVGLTGVPLILAILIVTTFVNFFIAQRQRQVVHLCAHLRAHVHDAGLCAGVRPGGLPHCRLLHHPITPIYPYLPHGHRHAAKYDKKFGMGNVISLMIPYSFGFLIVWTVFIILWMFLNLPLGPGAGVFL